MRDLTKEEDYKCKNCKIHKVCHSASMNLSSLKESGNERACEDIVLTNINHSLFNEYRIN